MMFPRGRIGSRAQVHPTDGTGGAPARELASRGITANAIAPGPIDSQTAGTGFDAAAIKRLVPMQRAGTPDEVAALVGFLASESAGYLTGQIIGINGGIV